MFLLSSPCCSAFVATWNSQKRQRLYIHISMLAAFPKGAVKSIFFQIAGVVLACFWLMLHSQRGAEAVHVCTTEEASAWQTHHLPVESSLMTKLR